MTERDDKKALHQEASYFDQQILERIANGHIPDLRRAPRCEYFYNNPWREPEYVKLDFGEQFELIARNLTKLIGPRAKVLEIGCGPGYLTLELARAGFDVTGVDLSQVCIDIAVRFAAEDPYKKERGGLNYHCMDILNSHDVLGEKSFDAVIFLGALHHFPDQRGINQVVTKLLKPGGYVLIHEPVRDMADIRNAAIVHLVRTVLSLSGGYFQKIAARRTPMRYTGICNL